MAFMTLGELFALPPITLEDEFPKDVDPRLASFSVEYLKKKHDLTTGILLENKRFRASLHEVRPGATEGEEVFEVEAFLSDERQVYLRVRGVGRSTRLYQTIRSRMNPSNILLHRAIVALDLSEGDSLGGLQVHHIGSRNLDNRRSNLQALTPTQHRKIHEKEPRNYTPIPAHLLDNLLLYLKASYLPNPSILAAAPVHLEEGYNVDEHSTSGTPVGEEGEQAPGKGKTLRTRTIAKLGYSNCTAKRMAIALRIMVKLGGMVKTSVLLAELSAKSISVRSAERVLQSLVSAGFIERTKQGYYSLCPGAFAG